MTVSLDPRLHRRPADPRARRGRPGRAASRSRCSCWRTVPCMRGRATATRSADANVIARGIVGTVGTGRGHRDTVASPMYKQVFDLATGECLTEPDRGLPVVRRPGRRAVARSRSATSRSGRSVVTELAPVLAGCRILVTAQRRADELAGALVRRGADVVVAPALGVVPHVDEDELLESTRKIIADAGRRGGGDHRDRLPRLAGHRRGGRPGRRPGATRWPASGWSPAGPRPAAPSRRPGCRPTGWPSRRPSAEIVEFLLAEGVDQQRIAVQRHGAGDDGLDAPAHRGRRQRHAPGGLPLGPAARP